MKKTILITGGLGFIGSHTAVELIKEGFDVVIVDNQVNSESFILDRIEQITGYLPMYYLIPLGIIALHLLMVLNLEILHFHRI